MTLDVNKIEIMRIWEDTNFLIRYAEKEDLQLWEDAYKNKKGAIKRELLRAVAEVINDNRQILLTWKAKRKEYLVGSLELIPKKGRIGIVYFERVWEFDAEIFRELIQYRLDEEVMEIYRKNKCGMLLLAMLTTKRKSWGIENVDILPQKFEVDSWMKKYLDSKEDLFKKKEKVQDEEFESKCWELLRKEGWIGEPIDVKGHEVVDEIGHGKK